MPEPITTSRAAAGRYTGEGVGPPAELFDDTIAHAPDRFADAESMTRRAAVAPATWDAEALTVEAVAATDTPVARRDARGPFLERLDMATVALGAARDVPVLDNHTGTRTRDVVGIVQSLRIEGGQLIAKLRLSAADDALAVVQRVAEGTVTGVSVGYSVAGWRETIEDGQRVKRPTAWSIREISLTPTPADPNSRVRSTKAPDATARSGGTLNNRANSNGGPMPDPVIETPTDAERARRADIRNLVRSAGLPDATADDLIDTGATIEEAKALAFDHVQTRSASRPVIRTATAQNDDPAVIVRRQADAIATRMTGAPCPDDARQYLGDSMKDHARSSLERAGISTRGMTSDQVFERAAHGTSDFPLVVSNAMGKTAAAAYQIAESPLKTLCRQRVLSDFKTSTSIRLGNMGRLEEIAENGEITHTTRAENGETMRLKTYARGLTVSRELLVNDDLGLLGDMVAEFGTAAAQTEADILVDLITSNPDLSDGTPVFDASRGNFASPGVAIGGSGDSVAFDAARKFMRTVTGLDGRTIISATPKYLVVGPESETTAEKFLAAIYATTVADVNAWTGKLSLLVETRITDDRWMIFADPARLACLQYGYLASAQGVQIQRADDWSTLGLKFRAFLDFGAGWLDFRGAYLNAGGS